MMATNKLVGIGLYTIPEAARLTGVSTQRIRGWLKGYKYPIKSGKKEGKPVWRSDIEKIDGIYGLSFLDLMEVKMINAFLEKGVKWKTIREAAQKACEMFRNNHPFTLRRFQTDGNRIFTELLTKEEKERLLDLNKEQFVAKDIVEQSFKDLEFDENKQVARWYPEKNKIIVVDPQRAFGAPILYDEGIPTFVLATAFHAQKSYDEVAEWYAIKPAMVKAAVEFEERLAA